MKHGLTNKQQQCYDFVRDYIKGNGMPPSYDEIRDGLGLASKSQVHRYIAALVERGYVSTIPNRARSIVILPEIDHVANVSQLTQIASAAKSYFQVHDDWQRFQKKHPVHADNSEYHAPIVAERLSTLRKRVAEQFNTLKKLVA